MTLTVTVPITETWPALPLEEGRKAPETLQLWTQDVER
jgi:hypothetical protein